MLGYASRTGTKKNLDALREGGWRLLVSARGDHRHEGFPYALDNGAWTAHTQGGGFDERKFMRLVEKMGHAADWLAVPDIVAGGERSLDYSQQWLPRLQGVCPLLLPVQDGMTVDMVRHLIGPDLGIFLGGSAEWKERSAHEWGALAKAQRAYFHVARVNTRRRMRIAFYAGADSFDGSGPSRFLKQARLMTRWLQELNQSNDLFRRS